MIKREGTNKNHFTELKMTSSYLLGDDDTICAQATAQGRGGVSVVRISGLQTIEIVRRIAAFLPKDMESHHVYFGGLKNFSKEKKGRFIDEVLITVFLNGKSYTGETLIEISCHGTPFIVKEIIDELLENGARLAKPGEFTYRAFINGKIDLVQAESVLNLIESQSIKSRQQSLQQLRGKLSKDINKIVEDMTSVLSIIEANIDFTTEDIQPLDVKQTLDVLKGTLNIIDSLILSYNVGKVLKEGYQVAIIGRPNVGKSSLLNSLIEKDRSIVSHISGTTRDIIEEQIIIKGCFVRLIDTAGLRETQGVVEKIGVQRAKQAILDADLLIFITDANKKSSKEVLVEDQKILKELPFIPLIKIKSKKDLNSDDFLLCKREIAISNKTGEGIENVKKAIGQLLEDSFEGSSVIIMQARQMECLKQASKSLKKGVLLLEKNESLELIALELQIGLKSLFILLGREFSDEVMNRVFREFCIGK